MNKQKSPYLPKQRSNYNPSKKEVENATGVKFDVNMPNPVQDSIAVNNIACQEFDYTENMTDTDSKPTK